MWNTLASLADNQARAAVRRLSLPAALILIGPTFVLLGALGIFAALFLWLAPEHGPVAAALIVAVVAFALGLAALVPVLVRRRQKIPPPVSPVTSLASTLPQIVPLLGPRPIALGAVLLALVLGLLSRHSSEDPL